MSLGQVTEVAASVAAKVASKAQGSIPGFAQTSIAHEISAKVSGSITRSTQIGEHFEIRAGWCSTQETIDVFLRTGSGTVDAWKTTTRCYRELTMNDGTVLLVRCYDHADFINSGSDVMGPLGLIESESDEAEGNCRCVSPCQPVQQPAPTSRVPQGSTNNLGDVFQGDGLSLSVPAGAAGSATAVIFRPPPSFDPSQISVVIPDDAPADWTPTLVYEPDPDPDDGVTPPPSGIRIPLPAPPILLVTADPPGDAPPQVRPVTIDIPVPTPVVTPPPTPPTTPPDRPITPPIPPAPPHIESVTPPYPGLSPTEHPVQIAVTGDPAAATAEFRDPVTGETLAQVDPAQTWTATVVDAGGKPLAGTIQGPLDRPLDRPLEELTVTLVGADGRVLDQKPVMAETQGPAAGASPTAAAGALRHTLHFHAEPGLLIGSVDGLGGGEISTREQALADVPADAAREIAATTRSRLVIRNRTTGAVIADVNFPTGTGLPETRYAVPSGTVVDIQATASFDRGPAMAAVENALRQAATSTDGLPQELAGRVRAAISRRAERWRAFVEQNSTPR